MAQNPAVVTPRGPSRFKHDPQAAPRVRQANPGVTAGSHVTSPLPKSSMTIEGPNVVDESGDKMPTIPPAPEQPVLPVDDPFRKMRLSKA